MSQVKERPDHDPALTGWTEDAAHSKANADLHRIRQLFSKARDLAARWANAHDANCDCPYCTRPNVRPSVGPDQARRTVAGVHWAAEMAASDLENLTMFVRKRGG